MSLSFALLCWLSLAPQEVPASKPQATPPRRARPEWKASLTLPTDLWVDGGEAALPLTAEWTNKVEIADLNHDGRADLLFANGGDYDTPGKPLPARVFFNQGAGKAFEEGTERVFGKELFLARVIKVRDVTEDGLPDILVGTTFGTQSRLFVGLREGGFRDATALHLPVLNASVGDAEFGDVDLDGDLDLVVADWGSGSPMKNEGGRVRLWLNQGFGRFAEATEQHMPAVLVRFCWELEWVDVDQDLDLDLLVSSKRSPGSFLFLNDGKGHFEDVSAQRLPQFTNNYEFEAMDLDGDSVLDLVTINDGPRFREHVFRGDGKGGFTDVTAAWWPEADNPSFDDNMVTFLDFDSDGDADFLIGSLDGPDRLLVNDGQGKLAAAAPVFQGDDTRGTLGIALADLNGDARLDVVHAQGENPRAEAEKVFFGKSIAPDTAAPSIAQLRILGSEAPKAGQPFNLAVRVHDRKTPIADHDFRSVKLLVTQAGKTEELSMKWYGELLWRANIASPKSGKLTAQVVAIDAAGNRAEGALLELEIP